MLSDQRIQEDDEGDEGRECEVTEGESRVHVYKIDANNAIGRTGRAQEARGGHPWIEEWKDRRKWRVRWLVECKGIER